MVHEGSEGNDRSATDPRVPAAALLERILAEAGQALGTERSAIFRWPPDGSSCVTHRGVSRPFVEAVGRSDAHLRLRPHFEGGEPTLLSEPVSPSQAEAWRVEGIGSAILQPVHERGDLRGVLALYFDRLPALDAVARAALRLLARMVAPALEAVPPPAVEARPAASAPRFWADACQSLVHSLADARVSFALTLARLGAGTPDAGTVVASLAALDRRLATLASALEALASLALLDSGGLELAPASLPMERVVREMVHSLRERFSPRPFRTFAPSGERLHCAVDRARLEDALGYLVGVAVRHSPADATVRIALARGHRPAGPGCAVIMIHAARGAAASVDLGGAFAHELRPEIRSSTDTELGAYVARRLIELHGGSLWTDTTDAAVTLAFHLPLVASPTR